MDSSALTPQQLAARAAEKRAQAPVQAPIQAPVQALVQAPVQAPIQAPVKAPTPPVVKSVDEGTPRPAIASTKTLTKAEQLGISVKDQTGEETFFKVKLGTKFGKVFVAYANRKGVDSSALRFLFQGQRISPDDTPAMLEMEDQDQIDCFLEQTGGFGSF